MAKTKTNKTSSKNENVKSVAKKTTKKTISESTITPKKAKTKTKKKTPSIIQEENNYGRTILAGILIIVIFVGGFIAVKYKENIGLSDNKYVATADEKKFKEEYESLNGTTRTSGIKNKEVTIIEDNNITYITPDEAVDILDAGSGIIYFGYSACPWSRNAVPVLLKAMSSSKLDKIYYVDVRSNDDPNKDIRDTYILNSKNKARKSKDADKSYYNILLALANELEDYVLYTDSGKKVNTGEKRLNTPTVVAIKDGVLVGFHEGTVEDHEEDENGTLKDLTKDEETKLLNTYTDIISKYLNS